MDQILELVDRVGRWRVAGALGLLVVLGLLRKLLSRRSEPSYLGHGRCGCGWQGTVSRFKATCPKCGRPIAQVG